MPKVFRLATEKCGARGKGADILTAFSSMSFWTLVLTAAMASGEGAAEEKRDRKNEVMETALMYVVDGGRGR